MMVNEAISKIIEMLQGIKVSIQMIHEIQDLEIVQGEAPDLITLQKKDHKQYTLVLIGYHTEENIHVWFSIKNSVRTCYCTFEELEDLLYLFVQYEGVRKNTQELIEEYRAIKSGGIKVLGKDEVKNQLFTLWDTVKSAVVLTGDYKPLQAEFGSDNLQYELCILEKIIADGYRVLMTIYYDRRKPAHPYSIQWISDDIIYNISDVDELEEIIYEKIAGEKIDLKG